MIIWKVFYDDREPFSNLDGPVGNIPTRGVQAIVGADDKVGRYLLHGADYYWWIDDCWLGGDLFGLYDQLLSDGWHKIIFGRMITREKFQPIIDEALKDSDFPRKSGWHQSEIKPPWIK